ncbi:MAG: VWA domain-containing protein [Candidatus Sulfotelmatobacter sp.]|jgi:VWFA-related protein
MGRLFRLFLVLLLPLSAVWAQNAPSPQLQPRTPESTKVPSNGTDRRITLDVQVTDKAGAPIRGLQQQDFTLLDDKLPLNIVSFQAVDSAVPAATDPPLEVILVVDAVNASFQAVSNEKNELKKYLLQNGGKLPQPMSLILFTDTGAQMQNGSSRDGNVLASLLDQYELGLRENHRSQGVYGAEERFSKSLTAISQLAAYERTRPGRKLVIWISPGWPLLSGPRISLSAKEEQQLFNSIVAASTELRQARITLYSVDPLGLGDFRQAVYYEEFLKGVSSPSRALPANLGLPVLAVQTGGRVLNLTNDITAAVAECAADANAFYVISFDPPRADKPNEYHSVGIAVDKPGITARTRTGYYNQP